ncbi:hypothetical protein [Paenibacillus sp. GCM10023250]|uniref:hypothetical protein n=1 Tax=Paenibacillus sp. GCM10023250 TaxID=3252648 RepID=UPI003619731B
MSRPDVEQLLEELRRTGAAIAQLDLDQAAHDGVLLELQNRQAIIRSEIEQCMAVRGNAYSLAEKQLLSDCLAMEQALVPELRRVQDELRLQRQRISFGKRARDAYLVESPTASAYFIDRQR